MDAAVRPTADPTAVADFIARWKGKADSERSNFQSFMRDLCVLLSLVAMGRAEYEEETSTWYAVG